MTLHSQYTHMCVQEKLASQKSKRHNSKTNRVSKSPRWQHTKDLAVFSRVGKHKSSSPTAVTCSCSSSPSKCTEIENVDSTTRLALSTKSLHRLPSIGPSKIDSVKTGDLTSEEPNIAITGCVLSGSSCSRAKRTEEVPTNWTDLTYLRRKHNKKFHQQ